MSDTLPSIKKEDTTPFAALSGRDPLDELHDTQRRRIEEMRQNKKIGWGSLPSLTTRRTGDANPGTGPADLMSRLGATFGTLGRSEHAVEFYQQALEGYRSANDREGQATTLASLAKAYWQQQNGGEAIKTYTAAAELYHLLNQSEGHATALNCIGLVYDQQGDLATALGYYEQALAILWDAGDRAGEANTFDVIGMTQRRLGLHKDALKSHKCALEIRLEQGDKEGEASTRHAMAMVFEETGDDEKAICYYEWALRIRRGVMDRPGEAITSYNLAKLYLRKSLLVEAETLMARAVEIESLMGHSDLAKDEIALGEIRAKRRAAGLPAPNGDSTGKFPKITLPAEPPVPEGSSQRNRPITRT
jgi:tetratricopeptide (TPR) repeat protein